MQIGWAPIKVQINTTVEQFQQKINIEMYCRIAILDCIGFS